MSRLAVVLAALLIVTAGCSGLSGGDSTPDREPYNVDEQVNATVEEEPEELLPGLTTEGVTNFEAFRESHESAIGNRSYTIETETEFHIESENETFLRTLEMELRVDPEAGLVREVIHRQFEGNPSPSFLVSNQYVTDGANRTVERWFGNTTVSRTEFENGSAEYGTFEEGMWTPDTRIEQVSNRLLTPLQNVGETTTAGMVDAEDGTYYVIEAEDNTSEDEVGSNQPEHEIEARTLVHEDGLIRQTVVEQDAVVENEDRTVINQTTEITDIGETRVERPDWYEDALQAQPEEPDGPESNPKESAGNESTE